MKAIITTKYGTPDVLKIIEVKKPKPKKNELLIKNKAIAVTSGDCRMRALNPPYWFYRIPMALMLGIFRPRKPIQGLWFAGVIEEVGATVKKFKVGEKVYARTIDLVFGANSEYVCLPENSIIGLMPQNVSYEKAVSIPFGGLTALYFLQKANIKEGDNLLIYGASGSVGIAAVQLGKIFGANITAVCSTENINMVKEYGAHRVIDYTKENFQDCNSQFDIVFDAVGYITKKAAKDVLKRSGLFFSVISSGHAKFGVKELNFLSSLVNENKLKSVLDVCYSFDQMVEAHTYVDKGHKKGNVAVILD